ncbi:hypothetical protein Pint_06994 [Pistacia integerrima]|uniref:Uncharacterized protein n=1 Tax=Pistacia integerrima TaxID=434235 RepID=A0ACC0XWL5_9ROSI|nr:hypothetical protein Pint_06994 [Pistacia integerrima]
MQEDLCCQLFGLPQDSMRAMTPGLPLFLCSYTAYYLHEVFQVCLVIWRQTYNSVVIK